MYALECRVNPRCYTFPTRLYTELRSCRILFPELLVILPLTILKNMSIPLTIVNRTNWRNDILFNETIQPLPNRLKSFRCRIGFLDSLHLCHVQTMRSIFIGQAESVLKCLYIGMKKKPFLI